MRHGGEDPRGVLQARVEALVAVRASETERTSAEGHAKPTETRPERRAKATFLGRRTPNLLQQRRAAGPRDAGVQLAHDLRLSPTRELEKLEIQHRNGLKPTKNRAKAPKSLKKTPENPENPTNIYKPEHAPVPLPRKGFGVWLHAGDAPGARPASLRGFFKVAWRFEAVFRRYFQIFSAISAGFRAGRPLLKLRPHEVVDVQAWRAPGDGQAATRRDVHAA